MRQARAHPGEITWIGLGPLTYLAIALLLLDLNLPSQLPKWCGCAARSMRPEWSHHCVRRMPDMIRKPRRLYWNRGWNVTLVSLS